MEANKEFESKKRVLHIPTSGVNAGGITKFITNTMKEDILNKNMEIYVLSPVDVPENILEVFRNTDMNLDILTGRTKNPVIYFLKLISYIKKYKFDIVHVHGSSALMSIDLLAAKIAGVKVRIAHSHNITCGYMRIHKLLNPLFQNLYTHSLACSEEAGKWLFGNKEFKILYNGINVEKFGFSEVDRKKIRQQQGFSEKDLIIGHIGMFNHQKNHAFLLDIFKKVYEKNANAKLVLIGSGKLEADIKEKAKMLGLTKAVSFIGNVDNISEWLSAMDVFVFPSLFEGFGIVLAEAQASGIQSVASDKVPDLVKITSKIKILPFDVGADIWADEILKSDINNRILHKEEKDKLALFDIKSIAKQMYGVYVCSINKEECR